MTTLDFPAYSDLAGFSDLMKDSYQAERARREKYRTYFDGDVFEERVPQEVPGEPGEAPKLYPVGMNLVKMLTIAQSEALFGEWEEDIVRFRVRQDVEENKSSQAAIELCQGILNANDFASKGYELALDREVYGGCAIKVGYDNNTPGLIRLSRIPLDSFYPVWDPDDLDRLLEMRIVISMSREQARAKYGYTGEKASVLREEKWTLETYENTIDGVRVEEYSGINPWGLIPARFIPRVRTRYWWGDALTPDIIPAQDELNMRVADMGEAINYGMHPIRYGINLPNKFSGKEYPMGPGQMWDLGRSMNKDNRPEVGLLETKNPLSEQALAYGKFLYDWTRTSSFTPPIAFGEDDGGGQRSGRTLEIRMWPLLRATRRSRSYFGTGLMDIMKIAATILQEKKIVNMSFAVERILDGTIVPAFWPLLPRDQSAIVDEITKLMALPVPQVSAETAQKMLGRGPTEVERIRKMMNDPDFKEKFAAPGPGAKPAGTPKNKPVSE